MESLDNFLIKEVNLTNCDREPIHIPPSSQRFSSFIVCDKEYKVIGYSENIKDLLDISASLFNKNILNYLPLQQNSDKKQFTLYIKDREYIVIKTDFEDKLYLEVFFNDKKFQPPVKKYNSIDEFLEISKEYFDIDRIMLYKFDEDYNGEVIHEVKNSNLPSYLHLHFPSSDIPKQVRGMYSNKALRVIEDIYGEEIAVKTSLQSLDLTPFDNRGVSKIHIEYLKNMGVTTALSIALFDEYKNLIALLAFHHREKKEITYSFLNSLQKWVQGFEKRLITLDEEKFYDEILLCERKRELFLEEYFKEGITESSFDLLLSILDSDYGFFVNEDNFVESKTLLSLEYKNYLISTIKTIERNGFFITKNAKLFFEGVDENLRHLRGVFSFKIDNTWVITFKKEFATEVVWAGKKESSEVLTPRNSFENWKELMKDNCKSWEHFRKSIIRKILIEIKDKNSER